MDDRRARVARRSAAAWTRLAAAGTAQTVRLVALPQLSVAGDPWEPFNFRADSDFTRPLQRTEYYTGNPGIAWQTQLFAHGDPADYAFGDEFTRGYDGPTGLDAPHGTDVFWPRLDGQ